MDHDRAAGRSQVPRHVHDAGHVSSPLGRRGDEDGAQRVRLEQSEAFHNACRTNHRHRDIAGENANHGVGIGVFQCIGDKNR